MRVRLQEPRGRDRQIADGSKVGGRGAHDGVMGADSQEARALAALGNGSDIDAGHPACDVLLLHLQQLPCLGELKVDDLAICQGQDDLHSSELFGGHDCSEVPTGYMH